MLLKIYLKAAVTQMSAPVFSQILVIIGLTHALVVFRAIVAGSLAQDPWEFMSKHSNIVAMMLGAVLHFIIITVMTRVQRSLNVDICAISAMFSTILIMSVSLQVNKIVAMKLCEIGVFKVPIPVITNIRHKGWRQGAGYTWAKQGDDMFMQESSITQ